MLEPETREADPKRTVTTTIRESELAHISDLERSGEFWSRAHTVRALIRFALIHDAEFLKERHEHRHDDRA